MPVAHITEAAAAADFAGLMARVRAGEEIIIESGSRAVAVIRPTEVAERTLSDLIALSEARAVLAGEAPVMDDDFAADMEEIIRNRKPSDRSAWD